MDIGHFSVREVLEIAIRIERNGIAFYTDACNTSKSERLQKLFSFLLEEEEKHAQCFEDMENELHDEVVPTILDPYSEEEAAYLKAMADARIFSNSDDPGRRAKSPQTENGLLKAAIQMEKDSILFYYEMQKAVREKDKASVESLIDEEKKHLLKLQDELRLHLNQGGVE